MTFCSLREVYGITQIKVSLLNLCIQFYSVSLECRLMYFNRVRTQYNDIINIRIHE